MPDGEKVILKQEATAGNFKDTSREFLVKRHRDKVEFVLSEGRPVPPEVLADYPDLAAKVKPPTPPAPPAEAGAVGPLDEWVQGTAASHSVHFDSKSPLQIDLGEEIYKGHKPIVTTWPVVDRDKPSMPKVLYHGRKADITIFKPGKGGAAGPGIYLAENPEKASAFAHKEGGKVYPVYTNVKNPLLIKGEDRIYASSSSSVASLERFPTYSFLLMFVCLLSFVCLPQDLPGQGRGTPAMQAAKEESIGRFSKGTFPCPERESAP